MPRLIATKRTRYARTDLQPGDAFDATDRDALVLTAAGLAREDDGRPFEPPAKRKKRGDAASRSKRKYNRRDMVAEGSQ